MKELCTAMGRRINPDAFSQKLSYMSEKQRVENVTFWSVQLSFLSGSEFNNNHRGKNETYFTQLRQTAIGNSNNEEAEIDAVQYLNKEDQGEIAQTSRNKYENSTLQRERGNNGHTMWGEYLASWRHENSGVINVIRCPCKRVHVSGWKLWLAVQHGSVLWGSSE